VALIKSEFGTVSTVCARDCDPALGLIRGAQFSTSSPQLTKGNELFFFTDGLVEETNPAGEEFGMHRLAAALARSRASSPEGVIADISASIRRFSTNEVHRDDYCALLASF
jgi:phosphoserine phosphatase RsbU/P